MTFTRLPDWEATVPFTGMSGTGLPGPYAPLPFPQIPALEPPPPQRLPDTAIWVILPRGAGFGLLCGMDRWRRHTDPEAAHAPPGGYFDAVRESALAAQWRPDAYGRWCCPRCKDDPSYATPQPLAHYHPGAAQTRPSPDRSRDAWLMRLATEHHQDAAAALLAGDPAAEHWFRAQAEHDMLLRTADGPGRGRHHRAGAS